MCLFLCSPLFTLFITGVVTLQIEETKDQQYCFGKNKRHFNSIVVSELFTSLVACKIISSVVAFVLSLLYDTSLWNGAECIPPLTGLLNGINGHKCILTDFNEVSIKY